jgi:glycosyltransferase involved in cell wall biosynthesis
MAAAAIGILRDPARHSAMAAAAAADARARFSQDAVVAEYESLYERTIAQRKARRAVRV